MLEFGCLHCELGILQDTVANHSRLTTCSSSTRQPELEGLLQV